MASTTMVYALLAKSKLIVGSRLRIEQASCINPLNSPILNVPNAHLSGSTEADSDTYSMARRFKDGYVVTAITASAPAWQKKKTLTKNFKLAIK